MPKPSSYSKFGTLIDQVHKTQSFHTAGRDLGLVGDDMPY